MEAGNALKTRDIFHVIGR